MRIAGDYCHVPRIIQQGCNQSPSGRGVGWLPTNCRQVHESFAKEAPVAAPPTALKRVAGNDAFVLFAYFLVFGIWTTASENDFISSNWKSVRRAVAVRCMYSLFSFL